MTRKEELLRSLVNNLAELKHSLDPDDKLSLEEYDLQHGEVEQLQHLVNDLGLLMGIDV